MLKYEEEILALTVLSYLKTMRAVQTQMRSVPLHSLWRESLSSASQLRKVGRAQRNLEGSSLQNPLSLFTRSSQGTRSSSFLVHPFLWEVPLISLPLSECLFVASFQIKILKGLLRIVLSCPSFSHKIFSSGYVNSSLLLKGQHICWANSVLGCRADLGCDLETPRNLITGLFSWPLKWSTSPLCALMGFELARPCRDL